MAEVLHNSDIRVKGKFIKDGGLATQFLKADGSVDDSAYEVAFAKGSAFNKNFGTTAGTVAQGNDSRIVNGQTAYNWGDHSTEGYEYAANLGSHAYLDHWYGTQAQYDAITTPDNDTIYYIEEQDVDVTAVAGDITSTDIANWTAVYNWYALGGAVLPTGTTGQLLYHNGTGWTTLAQGTDGNVLTLDSGLPVWAAGGSGGSGGMVYPGAGIAVSTGSGWDASITLGTGYLYYDGTTFSWQSGSSSAESDPIFSQSAAYNISAGQISHWDEVYTWYDSFEDYSYWRIMANGDDDFVFKIYRLQTLDIHTDYGIDLAVKSVGTTRRFTFGLNIWDESAIQSYFPNDNYILSVEEGSNLIRFTKRINASKSLAAAINLLDLNDIPSHPSAGYLYWTGSKYTWAAGAGGSVWSTDTYGITYQGGNVGIGTASRSTFMLAVGGNIDAESLHLGLASYNSNYKLNVKTQNTGEACAYFENSSNGLSYALKLRSTGSYSIYSEQLSPTWNAYFTGGKGVYSDKIVAGNGAIGTFTTADNKTVTVEHGIITLIS